MFRRTSEAAFVLVVDDDCAILSAASALLWMQGIGCRTAASGEEAIDIAAVEEPALVLVDWHMRRLNGPGVLKCLRQRGLRGPVILMSSHSAGLAEQASEHGFDGYLEKPFAAADVLELVERFARPLAV